MSSILTKFMDAMEAADAIVDDKQRERIQDAIVVMVLYAAEPGDSGIERFVEEATDNERAVYFTMVVAPFFNKDGVIRVDFVQAARKSNVLYWLDRMAPSVERMPKGPDSPFLQRWRLLRPLLDPQQWETKH